MRTLKIQQIDVSDALQYMLGKCRNLPWMWYSFVCIFDKQIGDIDATWVVILAEAKAGSWQVAGRLLVGRWQAAGKSLVSRW